MDYYCYREFPWLQSVGSLRVGHDSGSSLSLFTSMHWRRKWQPTPVFLPGESQGRGAWWAAVSGVAQSWTRRKRLSSSSSSSSSRENGEGGPFEKKETRPSLPQVLILLLTPSPCTHYITLFKHCICHKNYFIKSRILNLVLNNAKKIKLPTSTGSQKKQGNSRKISTSSLTPLKPLTV